ncbi:hypothetical protein BBP40_007353 [Aspergillus hancockii]|nr:hypothetical protein BBP40_007353 [Aspergillus hancockii]
MHVLIIGAGLTGLLIAQGLKKNGISCSVYEKARSHRGSNWGVTLHWAAQYWNDLLPEHLKKRLVEGQVDRMQDAEAMKGHEEIALRNGSTGERYCTLPFPGVRDYNVGRLKALLSEDIEVYCGKMFSHANFVGNGVTAVFEDGSEAAGTVLIGTDGNSSQVRRAALEPASLADPESLPFNMVNVTATYTAEQALYIRSKIHPVADIGIHPKGMYYRLNMLDIADPEKPESWEFQLLSTWRISDEDEETGPEKPLQKFKEMANDWADPHRIAAEWLPDTIKTHDDLLRHWTP